MSAVAPPAWPSVQLDRLTPSGVAGEVFRVQLAKCSLVQLFAKVQDGEQAAFAELHAQTRHRLQSVVYRVLGSVDLVEDVVQDSYLQVWRQRHQFQSERGSVLGWMSAIAHRRAVDRVRAVRRASERDTRYVIGDSSADTDHQTMVVDAVHAAAVTTRALSSLTAVQREALVLTYWDGQTAAEAAGLLGIPVPTLKSRVRSAMVQLRLVLNPHQLAS